MQETYKVYVRVNEVGNIIDINSDAFVNNTDGWIKVDEGEGDKYHHAQGNYLPKQLMNERFVYRYKLENNQIIERPSDEIELDYTQQPQEANDIDLALIELASIIAEQQAAIVELAAMIAKKE